MKKNKQNGQQLCHTSSVLTDLRVLKIPANAITGPLGSPVLFAVSTLQVHNVHYGLCSANCHQQKPRTQKSRGRAQLEWKEGFYLWGFGQQKAADEPEM